MKVVSFSYCARGGHLYTTKVGTPLQRRHLHAVFEHHKDNAKITRHLRKITRHLRKIIRHLRKIIRHLRKIIRREKIFIRREIFSRYISVSPTPHRRLIQPEISSTKGRNKPLVSRGIENVLPFSNSIFLHLQILPNKNL